VEKEARVIGVVAHFISVVLSQLFPDLLMMPVYTCAVVSFDVHFLLLRRSFIVEYQSPECVHTSQAMTRIDIALCIMQRESSVC
jgi:hypothetical protein